jgi:hypothetical protein
MSKKIVYYADTAGGIVVNWSVYTKVVFHPGNEEMNEKNYEWVTTWPVVSYDKETGVFETLNSVYRPVIH